MLMAVWLLMFAFWFNLLLKEADGVNLAYGKPTWHTAGKHTSDNAVDGRYTNRSETGNQCALSFASEEVTWLVDLEAICSINKIVLYHRVEGTQFANSVYAGRFLGFSVYVSNSTNKEEGFLCYHDTNHTATDIPSELTVPCDVQGRYVIYYNSRKSGLSPKFGYSGKAFINLCEVEVYGCPLGYFDSACFYHCPRQCRHCHYMYGTCLGGCTLGFAGHSCEQYERINMALHQPTFQLNSVYTSRNLVDGKKTDLSLGGNQCTTTAENKAFAMWWVDLKNTRRIERIRVYSRRDDKKWGLDNEFTSRFSGFTIVVSNTTDHKNGVVCYNDRVYDSILVLSVVDVFCSAIGRYVIYYNERFSELTDPYGYSKFAFVDLCEVEVYGCPVLEYGFENPKCTVPCAAMCKSRLENLSYKKNTWQHTTRSTRYSSRAVDGLYTDRSFRGNQCAATGDSYFALWWVDLGHVSRIDHIVMYFRTDNEPWGYSNGFTSYFLGFSLYISNTTNRLDGVRCFHDKTYTKQTIPDHVSIDCPYVGQYVFYYNERFPGIKYPEGYSKYAYGDLCEVEVYGCPSPVAEVPQCSEPCPVDCEQCYPGTGWCTKCKPGFEGAACEMICHAKTEVYVSQPLTYGGSKYDAMFSSTGLFFPKPKTIYPFTHIILQLYGKNSNIARVSLDVEKATNLTVSLYDSKRSQIKRRIESSRELESFNVNIENNFNSFVSYIDIIVHTFEPFIISNLRLPLRECVKNIKEKIPCNDQPPEFLKQAMQGGKM